MEGGCCDRHLFRNAKWVGMSHFAMRNDFGLMGQEAREGEGNTLPVTGQRS